VPLRWQCTREKHKNKDGVQHAACCGIFAQLILFWSFVVMP
jgi:hypothetical protein